MTRGILLLAAFILAGTGGAATADTIELSLKGHKFTPSEFTVPAGQKFQIKLTNNDETPAELESHDLKVEKIVVPGGTITVTAGPLKPGTYEIFDDYHPDDAKGIVTAKE
jgi:heme/copper-type cytochrome/quinol oxidase subunit 2